MPRPLLVACGALLQAGCLLTALPEEALSGGPQPGADGGAIDAASADGGPTRDSSGPDRATRDGAAQPDRSPGADATTNDRLGSDLASHPDRATASDRWSDDRGQGDRTPAADSAPGDGAVVYGTNLLQNPGCESGPPSDSPEGWTEVSGFDWRCGSEIAAQEGARHFFAGSTILFVAELTQNVDVSTLGPAIDGGAQWFELRGFMAGWSDDDTAQVSLEFVSAADQVLASWDSLAHDYGSTWIEFSHARLAPAGTRVLRLRLISRRYTGNDNDGYFDGLSLRASIGP